MPVIAILRHGQASFGTDDYDNLSDLGRLQAQVAGRELQRRGLRSPVLISGSLKRQRETAEIAGIEMGVEPSRVDSRFDEFDAHAAVEAHLGRPGATDGMDSGEFQRHLDAAMAVWMESGDPRWQQFVEGALSGLADLAASLPSGTDAVVATSAGVTAAITGSLLGASPDGVIALNRCSVNASITTVVSGARGLSLVTFNDHSHVLGWTIDDVPLLTHR
ncbi:MAG TPA: histidine phosphatase family protein [Actinobacteria bacterium]|nr:histidine phosphatase family protein [Actinomycetota bacterium]